MEIERWPLKICFQAIWNVILSAYRHDSTILQYTYFVLWTSHIIYFVFSSTSFWHSIIDTQTRFFVQFVIFTTLWVTLWCFYAIVYLQTRAYASAHTLSGPPCALLSPFIRIFALLSPTYVKGENATLFYTCVISYGILIWRSSFINEKASAQRIVIRSVLVVINPSSLFTVTGKLWVPFSK